MGEAKRSTCWPLRERKEKIDIIGSRDDVLRLIELIAKSEREEKKWVESMRKSILTSARKTQS